MEQKKKDMQTEEILELNLAKQAGPENLHPLIRNRWSPRAFSNQEISTQTVSELFEAARWSASANNEQPWTYAYALRGTEGFEKLWNCLMPGNQPWAKSAAVLFVAMYRNNFIKTGNENPWAAHDLGMANAQLLLQACHQDIYGHLMAGFDASKVTKVLNLDDNTTALCMGALGYLGDPDQLAEPYKGRELAKRSRISVNEFLTAL